MSAVVARQSISWQAAAQMCQAACQHAESIGVRINVAVVDNGGNLLAFQRMDGAFLHSIDIAQDKAYSALSFGFPTSKWPELYADDPQLKDGLNQRPRLVAIGGGIPIELDGEVIGGVGVSGASAEQDEDCARAGMAALVIG